MNNISIMAVAIACFGTVACSDMGSSRTVPASQTYPPSTGQQYSGMDNSMPGKQGGFNNDDINRNSFLRDQPQAELLFQ